VINEVLASNGHTWTDPQGHKLDPNQLKNGDLVKVTVEVKLPADANLDYLANIAIVDALPGGLEVENPRLETAAMNNAGRRDEDAANTGPGNVQFEDDRVVIFTAASREKRAFTYYLRATTLGHFALPPIQGQTFA
jgi:uncharacterized protein YfaS (alpha-2-macroglobulin family)